MTVLVISNMYPSAANPQYGSFVKNLHATIEQQTGIKFVYAVNRQARKGLLVNLWKYLALLMRALYLACKHRSEIRAIHAHYVLPPGMIGALVKKIFGWPLLVTSHGGDVNILMAKSGAIAALHRWTIMNADVVNPVSVDIKNKLQQRYALPESSFMVQNMGVDPALFYREAQARAALKLPTGKKIVLFVGNLIPRKAPDFFLSIVQAVTKNSADVVGYVVGDGAMRAELEAATAAQNITDRLIFVGRKPQSELRLWYSAADCVVFPSREEPFGLISIEAMACGAPVVATRVGGIPEVIRDRTNGLLIEKDDLAAGIQAVEVLLRDEKLLQQMIIAGHATANANLLPQIARTYAETYKKMRG